MPFPYNQEEIDELQDQNHKGALNIKASNSSHDKQRPSLILKKYDLTKWKPNMSLLYFLKNILLNKKNKAVFQKFKATEAATNPNAHAKRVPIFDIISFIELGYPDIADDCRSEVHCMKDLVASKTLVKKTNFQEILHEIDMLYHDVCFDETVPSRIESERNQRNGIVDAMKKHDWATKDQLAIASRIMRLSDMRKTMLEASRAEKDVMKAQKILKYHEYELLINVDELLAIVEKRDQDDWWFYALILLQLAFGPRWVELLISKFEQSRQDSYNPTFYVAQTGFAKESTAVARRYSQKLTKHLQEGKSLDDFSISEEDTEKLDYNPEQTVLKPVLFQAKGLTADVWIQLLKDVRSEIKREMDEKGRYIPGLEPSDDDEKDSADGLTRDWLELKHIITEPDDRKRMADFFYKRTADRVKKFWHGTVVVQRNVTHSLRKLYASLSHQRFGQDMTPNSWYMHVLQHSNMAISFAYMVLVVEPGLKKSEYTDMSKMLDLFGGLTSKIAALEKEVHSLKNKDKVQFQSNDRDMVWIGKFNSKYNRQYEDEEVKTAEFRSLLIELRDEVNIPLTAKEFTRDNIMKLGMTRRAWLYLNKTRHELIKEEGEDDEEDQEGESPQRKRRRTS